MHFSGVAAIVVPLDVLEESYHVITVDSEKERVAREVTEFVGEFRAMPTASAARC
jgi:hypothetical protein